MNLGSPIELYLTYYGWDVYGTLWRLFAATGLALYPFAVTVYTVWRGSSERATDDAPAAVTSVRAMQWALYTQFAVLILAAVPMTELQTGQLAYQKACGGGANEVGGNWNNTGTTWDQMGNTFGGGAEVRVPLVWSAVMSIASGINYAATEAIPCFGKVADLRINLATTTFSDVGVKNEYGRFYNECWSKAVAKFNEQIRGGAREAYVKQTFEASGLPPWDLNQLGSEYFLNTPGFYQRCTDTALCGGYQRAGSPVQGFPYDATRDGSDFNAAQIAVGVGQPTCQEWWLGTGGGNGLRERMIDQAVLGKPVYPDAGNNPVPAFVQDQIAAVRDGGDLTAGILNTPESEEAAILTALISNNAPTYTRGAMDTFNNFFQPALDGYNRLKSLMGGAAGAATLAAATAIPGVGGVAADAASRAGEFYTTMYIAKIGAPLMQALLLMLIYALLPIYLITSGYQVESVITAAVLIGTVKFFSVVWAIAAYLENAVAIVLYPNEAWMSTLYNAGYNAAAERTVLNLMLISLYVIVPVFLLYLVTLAGPAIRGIGDSLGGVGDGGKGIGRGLGNKGAGGATKGFGKLLGKNR